MSRFMPKKMSQLQGAIKKINILLAHLFLPSQHNTLITFMTLLNTIEIYVCINIMIRIILNIPR